MLPFTGLALTPSVAGGLMGFSSLGVMANSLLLRLTSRKLSKMDDGTSRPRSSTPSITGDLALAGSDARDEAAASVRRRRRAAKAFLVDYVCVTRDARTVRRASPPPVSLHAAPSTISWNVPTLFTAEGYRVQGPKRLVLRRDGLGPHARVLGGEVLEQGHELRAGELFVVAEHLEHGRDDADEGSVGHGEEEREGLLRVDHVALGFPEAERLLHRRHLDPHARALDRPGPPATSLNFPCDAYTSFNCAVVGGTVSSRARGHAREVAEVDG